MQANKSRAGSDAQAAFAPSISLPKGGGAVRGIGEKFGANGATGTGALNVPLSLSPGRSGFGPQLSLSYDSGAGNGPFGLGWSLALPSITRKTDQGLPRYNDAENSDDFIISGAEDLVPVLVEEAGQWQQESNLRTLDSVDYRIQRYRPRIEGLFARIERWTSLQTGDTHWRSIDRDNVTSVYGVDNNSRIFDPAGPDAEHPRRIFCWLISESYDDKGNVVVYQYKEENADGVQLPQVHERNRTASNRSAERYLKRIRYGNRVSRLIDAEGSLNDWMFEAVFDYGEHDADNPTPNDDGAWLCRHDPFSSYRSGFEVRSYRLCQRVLMFHHFPDEEGVGENCLVRSTDFVYQNSRNNPADLKQGNPIASFLASITAYGYRRVNDGYLKRSLPPVDFEYSEAVVQEELREIDLQSLENLPYGADDAVYRWLDLDGEGVTGIVTAQGGGWFYKRNISPITAHQNDAATMVARFSPVELIGTQPSLNDYAAGPQQFLDLAGDGHIDLVQFGRPVSGYFERTADDGWSQFVPFESVPSIRTGDPNLRFVDLTGDGHADILITEDDALTWYPSLAEAGFGTATRVAQALDEEKGPRLLFAGNGESVYLADLSGDGLTDLVRIRNGEVCYWPNLGYGHFGAKVSMDNAPWFEEPDLFNQKRILLADIDGSGVTDIIYLNRDRVTLYFNQSGNSWSEPQILNHIGGLDSSSSVAAVDLLGNGTACLVWSSSLPGETVQSMRYVDLMGGQKPHLLVRVTNNLGAETRVRYVSSTTFYMEDKFAGRPWLTKLPFPVHVVERIETIDYVSRNRFVNRFTYHHGYFDGIEREFRGFGMVEQLDTEEFGALSAEGTLSEATNIDAASHVPPVLTRTWYHTGALLEGSRISRQFERDYYHEGDISRGEGDLNEPQLRSMLIDDTILPDAVKLPDGSRLPWSISADDALEACRALKGLILRQEVYGLDGTEHADRPYKVTESNHTIDLLQPREGNRHAVFHTYPRENIDFHYERRLFEVGDRMLADPRVTHSMTLAVDPFGNVLESVAIAYGRRHADPDPSLTAEDRQKQARTLITCTTNRFTNAVLTDDSYRAPMPSESRTYELFNVEPAANQPDVTNLFRFEEMLNVNQLVSDGLHDIPYENVFGEGIQPGEPRRRLIDHMRSVYRSDDLSGSLPLGQLESLAVPLQTYRLAFTPSLVDQVYDSRVTGEMLSNEGGYVHSEGDSNFWIPSGRMLFSPDLDDSPAQELTVAREHFFLARRFVDPFGNSATVAYDPHDLLITETRDALGNTVRSEHDYRVLLPRLITDANGNRSAAAFDALGMVVGTAAMGKENDDQGDSLDGFQPDLDELALIAHLQDPFANSHNILNRATTRMVYDLHRYQRTSASNNPQPNVVYTLARETHDADLLPEQLTGIQRSFSYSDGFEREIQRKIQAEPGPVVESGPEVSPRWVGSGWTIFNNKGKPVRQYEPFFSATHEFEFARTVGVSPILFYDPIGRLIATLHPNHTWEKVVFDPWRQETWDVNDTVLQLDPRNDPDLSDFFRRLSEIEFLPSWHTQRVAGQFGETAEQRQAEQLAAEKTAVHASTPTVVWFDCLGRPFLTVANNRFVQQGETTEEQHASRAELDIQGNQREVSDPRNRIVMTYDYDMLGNQIHSSSMEAGERWILNNVDGNLTRAWNSRGHAFRNGYDELRRPVQSFVTGADADNPDLEILFQRTVYGEGQGNTFNHRGRVFQVFDGAGVVINEAYDFKGNLLRSSRQLAADYTDAVDWSLNPALESEVFVTQTTYDALNRPVSVTIPDNSRIHPVYNEANLLERVEVNLRGADAVTVFVNDIEYNAKGERELIEYGNGVRTTYEYDPLTTRLSRMQTLRGDTALQDLSYTYDPVGNISGIRDGAQQATYFNNQVVEAHAEYTYDAIYRLIEAGGREHTGQVLQPQTSWNDEFRVNLPHPNDGQAMRRYTERYEYDEAGNILNLVHQAVNGNWTRAYTYSAPSLLQPQQTNNRLTSTTISGITEDYLHDAHGNMTRMPHLFDIGWDFHDQMRRVDLGGGGTAFYVYDSDGRRVRKIHEHNGSTVDERIYIGKFEIYRRRNLNGLQVERETLHIMDDTRSVAMVETLTVEDGSPIVDPASRHRYVHDNHLGSATVELDENGLIISYEEFYPFGSTSYQAVRPDTEVSAKRYRYTGKERDQETGLSYHGTRYYATWLGLWVSADPAGLVDGVNLYRYARNNPLTFVDETGLAGSFWSKAKALLAKAGKFAGRVAARGGQIAVSALSIYSAAETGTPGKLVGTKPTDPSAAKAEAEGEASRKASKKHKKTPGTGPDPDPRPTPDVGGGKPPVSGGVEGPTHLDKQTVHDVGDLQIQEGATVENKKGNFLTEVANDGGSNKVVATLPKTANPGYVAGSSPASQIPDRSPNVMTARGVLKGAARILPVVGIFFAVPAIAEAAERGEYGRAAAMTVGTFFEPVDIAITVQEAGEALRPTATMEREEVRTLVTGTLEDPSAEAEKILRAMGQ